MVEAHIKASEEPNNLWYLIVFFTILVLRVFFWFSPSHAEKISNIYLWPLVISSAAVILVRTPSLRRLKFALTAMMVVWFWISAVVPLGL